MPALVEFAPRTETAGLLQQIDRTRLPRHVAAIMDGNGRWAARKGLERVQGHSAGVGAVRDTVEGAAGLGLDTLTLFAFSIENWSRPRDEIEVLMDLVKHYLAVETANLIENDICFRAIGRLGGLPLDVQRIVSETTEATAGCRGLRLNIALNYSGRAEIVDAARRIAVRAAREGRVPDFDEDGFAAELDTKGSPELDLLIRTSGERRVSNFLLFQMAYAEFWTTETLWPDFRREDLYRAILWFQNRSRRYGGVPAAGPGETAPLADASSGVRQMRAIRG